VARVCITPRRRDATMKKLFVALALVLLATAVVQAQNVSGESILKGYYEKKAQDAARRQREAEPHPRDAGQKKERLCKNVCTGQLQSCELAGDPTNCR